MERPIDDNTKRQLLDKLSEEPPMVLSTAYAYARNYVQYGDDITKAWTTAVQQASIIEKARQQAWVEAYDSFKKEYENRLKADMVAMLTELKKEIEEIKMGDNVPFGFEPVNKFYEGVSASSRVIQQKIDALKSEDKE